MQQEWQEITLGSDIFKKAREDFDFMLQKLLKSMYRNDSTEGSITMKVNVDMKSEFVMDMNGESCRVDKPVFEHKVDTTVPLKNKTSGKNETGMVLVFDEELGRYVLEYDTSGAQKTIFDPEYQQAETIDADARQVDEETEVKGIAMLKDQEEAQEPQEPDTGVIDVECEETKAEEDSNCADGDTEIVEGSDYEYD